MRRVEATPNPKTLISEIKNRIGQNVALVGIGNILRGDDGLGPRFIEALKAKNLKKASLFDCGTAPENYIIPILSSSCDTVILIDAADFDMPAGSIKIFTPEEISNAGFSTHTLSPRLCIDLLRTGRDNLNIFIISIQPKTSGLGDSLSEEVRTSIDILTEAFSRILA